MLRAAVLDDDSEVTLSDACEWRAGRCCRLRPTRESATGRGRGIWAATGRGHGRGHAIGDSRDSIVFCLSHSERSRLILQTIRARKRNHQDI